ncbi:hypothetical protein CYMTET_5017 [Cymbomonas tetramitiformis]|uniref:ABC transporter domain-containing protein n=1 Tax=Cymbomonas tetramitiformis TaxID=36881 RepID=A0AAE0H089_9CHLO|nr:hypothetical protein CYMTET_5017 [Cymbomonas tetramitiformis]
MTPDERIALLEHDLLQLRENEIKLKSKIEEQAAELAELHVALRQAAPQTSPRESEAEVFHDASDSNLSDSGAPTLPPIRDISFRSFAKEVKFMQKSMNALEETSRRVKSLVEGGDSMDETKQKAVQGFLSLMARSQAKFTISVKFSSLQYLVESSAAGSTKSSVLQAACTPFARCCGAEASTHLTVLNGVSGHLRPETITLLLGPPASGKTSLLRTIANRLHHWRPARSTFSGQLYYNDTPAEDAAHMSHRFVSFIRQNEEHIACLTVRETLKFAHLCQLGRDMSFWKSMHEDVSDSEELQSLLTTRHVLLWTNSGWREQLGLTPPGSSISPQN